MGPRRCPPWAGAPTDPYGAGRALRPCDRHLHARHGWRLGPERRMRLSRVGRNRRVDYPNAQATALDISEFYRGCHFGLGHR